MVCRERAMELIRNVNNENGYETWRVLNKRFEPSTSGRFAAMLRSILNFKFEGEVFRSLDRFDSAVRDYEKGTGKSVGGDVKIAIVASRIQDEKMRDYLQMSMDQFFTYDDMVKKIEDTANTRKDWMIDPDAMQVDAILGKGKDKSGKGWWEGNGKVKKGKGKADKGKGKKSGKGKTDSPNVKCCKRRQYGHVRNNCPQNEKEGDKGGTILATAIPDGIQQVPTDVHILGPRNYLSIQPTGVTATGDRVGNSHYE